eukprot:01563_5
MEDLEDPDHPESGASDFGASTSVAHVMKQPSFSSGSINGAKETNQSEPQPRIRRRTRVSRGRSSPDSDTSKDERARPVYRKHQSTSQKQCIAAKQQNSQHHPISFLFFIVTLFFAWRRFARAACSKHPQCVRHRAPSDQCFTASQLAEESETRAQSCDYKRYFNIP